MAKTSIKSQKDLYFAKLAQQQAEALQTNTTVPAGSVVRANTTEDKSTELPITHIQNFREGYHDYKNGQCEVLQGNWKAGWALDFHTISSVVKPDGKFDTKYTNLGYALNRLKYHNDYEQLPFLIEQMVLFLKTRMVLPYIDVIFPVPASKQRDVQPVYEIANGVAQKLHKPIDFGFIRKIRDTSELKSIQDLNERQAALSGAFEIANANFYRNKKILLIDDLFRSGSTLNEIASVLYQNAGVQNVYVVTLTKTRVNR